MDTNITQNSSDTSLHSCDYCAIAAALPQTVVCVAAGCFRSFVLVHRLDIAIYKYNNTSITEGCCWIGTRMCGKIIEEKRSGIASETRGYKTGSNYKVMFSANTKKLLGDPFGNAKLLGYKGYESQPLEAGILGNLEEH